MWENYKLSMDRHWRNSTCCGWRDLIGENRQVPDGGVSAGHRMWIMISAFLSKRRIHTVHVRSVLCFVNVFEWNKRFFPASLIKEIFSGYLVFGMKPNNHSAIRTDWLSFTIPTVRNVLLDVSKAYTFSGVKFDQPIVHNPIRNTFKFSILLFILFAMRRSFPLKTLAYVYIMFVREKSSELQSDPPFTLSHLDHWCFKLKSVIFNVMPFLFSFKFSILSFEFQYLLVYACHWHDQIENSFSCDS